MRRILVKIFTLFILLGLFVTPLSNANYSDTETSVANTFTAGCWSPPSVPVLVSPANNIVTNSADINLDWSDSSFICPGQTVEYQYKWNSSESAWQQASAVTFSVAEGTYTWQVRAKDSQGYISDYSVPWTLTIDRTPPVTNLSFNGKIINEKILNGGFESGIANWERQGQVVIQSADVYTDPNSGAYMARIGHTVDDGSEIWENKLSQKLQPGAKNLSFYYNFFSYDSFNDDPGMVVRLNDYNVFYLSAADINNFDTPNSSGWTQLSFDISQIPDPTLEIIFYSGNTSDEVNQSWVYIDDVSTAEAVANNDQFTLTANESAQTYYSFDGGPFVSGTSFNLSAVTGSTLVRYYSLDSAGNSEGINTRRLVKDPQKPDAITDLLAFATSKQTVDLTWTVPADTTVYDIRYALTPILDEADFAVAQAGLNPPAPRRPGEFQSFTVSGLDSNTLYYFALKSADAALNWSDISNIGSDTTLDPVDPLSDPDINPGDVIINELMWMGTSGSSSDEFLELRNMTDQEIDLSGWQITKWVSGVNEALMLTIPGGKVIPAHGYFLIANFDKSTSKINIEPDLVDNSLVIVNDNLQIKLYNGNWTDPANLVIDAADNGEGVPAAGQFDSGGNIYYSMERDATPGNGENADVWHTIFDDSALMHSYWDLDAVEKGTPGAPNLSQSPTIITQPESTPEPILLPLPEIATESTVIIEPLTASSSAETEEP
ncbi:MAG: Peptidase families S8 and S53 domain protein [Candidatus Beckwithbacteria bacterium GW2011_GWA2_43_10]|uniref:Peptidase families S8 and S53 domain protein n=1 Tax=Candidatus Beckwithbacteria bacterium GW2011_GWA2_43_10 TaxID=1618369 RepID=A0A0G1E6R7_9BACT|nr:MAG: Peptidase families S8 and S53 domain protein [Candidatus Beckwithbacteria bacterium GW2011_GWA2_43_10]